MEDRPEIFMDVWCSEEEEDLVRAIRGFRVQGRRGRGRGQGLELIDRYMFLV